MDEVGLCVVEKSCGMRNSGIEVGEADA